MSNFEELIVYKRSFEMAMDIFEISKTFPKEERYSLTDQIRRSSRSVCACIAESYRKRNYLKHFIAKLSDSDMENAETQTWLHFALKCKYITKEDHGKLLNKSKEIGKLLGFMIQNPTKFI